MADYDWEDGFDDGGGDDERFGEASAHFNTGKNVILLLVYAGKEMHVVPPAADDGGGVEDDDVHFLLECRKYVNN